MLHFCQCRLEAEKFLPVLLLLLLLLWLQCGVAQLATGVYWHALPAAAGGAAVVRGDGAVVPGGWASLPPVAQLVSHHQPLDV
jgi:hypothetical protein